MPRNTSSSRRRTLLSRPCKSPNQERNPDSGKCRKKCPPGSFRGSQNRCLGAEAKAMRVPRPHQVPKNKSMSPIVIRSRSISRSPSRSPLQSRAPLHLRFPSHSPVPHRSRSPVRLPVHLRFPSHSPVRLRSRSPARLPSRSPVRNRSRSPARLANGRLILGKPGKHGGPRAQTPVHIRRAKTPTLASCLASKRKLQISLLSLAAKLSIARAGAGKPKPKQIKAKAKPKPKARSKSSSSGVVSRNTSSARAAKERDIRARKAARVGKEDDFFASLARRYMEEPISEAEIAAVLRQADDDANVVTATVRRKLKTPVRKSKSKSPVRLQPVPVVVAKRRIAPTFLGRL